MAERFGSSVASEHMLLEASRQHRSGEGGEQIKIQLLADMKKKKSLNKPQITKKKNPVRRKESNKSVEDGCLELFSLMHARFLLSALPPPPPAAFPLPNAVC